MYKTISTTSLDSVKFTLRSDSVESFALINDLGTEKDIGTEWIEECHETNEYDTRSVRVGEIVQKIPAMRKTQSMEEFLVIEEFFANSLRNLREFFATTNGKLIAPISVEKFGRMSLSEQNQCIFMLKDIMGDLSNLRNLIRNFNESLAAKYDRVKSHLRLSILMNVKSYHMYENSRAMMLALCDIKKIFEELNFQSVHNLLDDINDKVFDFNSHMENAETEGSDSSGNISSGTSINYNTLKKFIYLIESTLSEQSPFINDECAYFKGIIDEVKFGFSDYFHQFTKLTNDDYDDDTVFRYEILLFDDHLKTQYINYEADNSF